VGKDESGVMYGRNLLIPGNVQSYQKTPLTYVKNIDVAAVKADLLNITGIEEEEMSCFNLYGELMCNKGLYDYTENQVDGTH